MELLTTDTVISIIMWEQVGSMGVVPP